jgi:hypothetical protein
VQGADKKEDEGNAQQAKEEEEKEKEEEKEEAQGGGLDGDTHEKGQKTKKRKKRKKKKPESGSGAVDTEPPAMAAMPSAVMAPATEGLGESPASIPVPGSGAGNTHAEPGEERGGFKKVAIEEESDSEDESESPSPKVLHVPPKPATTASAPHERAAQPAGQVRVAVCTLTCSCEPLFLSSSCHDVLKGELGLIGVLVWGVVRPQTERWWTGPRRWQNAS